MEGINGVGAGRPAHVEHNGKSRRPGTPGHPGKHLGQFKNKIAQPDAGNASIIQQLLSAMTMDNGKGANKAGKSGALAQNKTQSQQPNDANYQLALSALRDTHNSISDQLSFTSRFNAITTVY